MELPAVKEINGFPILSNMYDFFTRSKNIEVWSLGFQNGEFETNIAEAMCARIKIFDSRTESKERYNIFKRVMDSHEPLPDDPKWASALTNHWILPDSTSLSSRIPFTFSGTLLLPDSEPGVATATTTIAYDFEKTPRLDICNINYGEHTTTFLYSILGSGYRPGLIFVSWPIHPDESNVTMAAAGHIQTLGYRLLKTVGNNFLYIFMDECMYEICSWSRTDCTNPMFTEFQKQILGGTSVQNAK